MNKFSWIGLAMLVVAPLAVTAAVEPAQRFTGQDLFLLEAAEDPQISPDGRWIAYVRATNDVMVDKVRRTVWLIDVSTGRQTPLGTDLGESPRWSADGSRLAVLSAGQGTAQLHIRSIRAGATQTLELPEDADHIAWSADGSQIAFTAPLAERPLSLGEAPQKPAGAHWAEPLMMTDKTNFRLDGGTYLTPAVTQLFSVSIASGNIRQLTHDRRNVIGPLSWAPDGRTILFTALGSEDREFIRTHPIEANLYSVDVASGSVAALTQGRSPHLNPGVSPDGVKVVYLSHDDSGRLYDHFQLYLMNRDGSGAHSLTASLDRSIEQFQWVGRESLDVAYADRGLTRVARVGLDGRMAEKATAAAGGSVPYTGGSFSVSTRGAIAFTNSDAKNPSNLYWVNASGKARPLTRLNAFLESRDLATVRPLPVTAPDGQHIDAWLLMPQGVAASAKVPLILEIHGGPLASYGPGFAAEHQLYAAAGYAVLFANPRGSTSYGDIFANAIEKKYPGADYDDLMAAVDAAVASGIADPKNLFVAGYSAGGTLSAWIVGKTRRFRAAAVQAPIVNWTSWLLTTDQPTTYWRPWFREKPWEDPTAYWARAPLSLVGSVETPTLVIVGSDDHIVPASEGEQLYTALSIRGVPTVLIKVPGVGHGSIATHPSQEAARISALIAWFDRYRSQAP